MPAQARVMPGVPAPTDRGPARRSGVVVPERPRWHGRLAARLIHALAMGLAATLRWEVRDESGMSGPADDRQAIFVIWHNRLALCLPAYRRLVGRKTAPRRLAALVSASRDGGLLARTLELFGAEPVRGSSSRRGAQALRELVSAAARGCNLAVTPDGPRGPKYRVAEGVVAAAQVTGLPLVPVALNLGWRRDLRSWDAFQIPLPFSRCEFRLGPPLLVPRDLDAAGREAACAELARRLAAINRD